MSSLLDLMISLAMSFTIGTTPVEVKSQSGLAMYYNPGVMDEVEANRLNQGTITTCEECIGRVALLDASLLDQEIWIQRDDGPIEGPFHVIDCASQHHREMLTNRGWVVDVDYETSRRWKMAGPVEVTIYYLEPVQ